MSPTDFLRFIECAESQRSLMARVLLCTCGYAEAFPVEISELDRLSPFNRAGVCSLMSWVDWNYGFRLGEKAAQSAAAMVNR